MKKENLITYIYFLLSLFNAYILLTSKFYLFGALLVVLIVSYFIVYIIKKKDKLYIELFFDPLVLNIDWFMILLTFYQLICFLFISDYCISNDYTVFYKILILGIFIFMVLDIFRGVKELKEFLIDINQKLEEKLIEINNFQIISKALNSILDLERLLNMILEIAIKLLKVENISLFLYDSENKCLIPKIYKGLPDDIAKSLKIKPGEGIIGYVAETGENLLIKDIERDERFAKKSSSKRYRTKSLICVPLKIKEDIIGVLSINNKKDGRPFEDGDLEIATIFASQAAIAIENANLYENMHKSYISTVRALSVAIEAKDKYTSGHSSAVTEYTIPIAEELGLDKKEIEKLEYASLLHDIGKIGIMEQILNKPGRLTNEEFEIIKKHPVIGYEILRSIDFLKDVTLLVKYHHERWDGKGYPDGLKGEEIPLGARIISVADTFDAMTSDRPYRKGLPVEVAVEEIKRCSGTQFDPEIVDAFLRAMENGKIKLYENRGELHKILQNDVD